MSGMQFDACFWLSMAGIILGFVSGMSVYCLKSKCSKCALCYGLVVVDRDIEREIIIEEKEIEQGRDPYSGPRVK